MKKVIALALFAFLSANSSFASVENCGMTPDGKQAEISFDICPGNFTVDLMTKMDKNLPDSLLLMNTHYADVKKKEMAEDQNIRREAEETFLDFEDLNKLQRIISFLFLLFAVPYTIYVLKYNRAEQSNNTHEKRYSLLKISILWVFGIVLFFLPISNKPVLSVITDNISIASEMGASYAARLLQTELSGNKQITDIDGNNNEIIKNVVSYDKIESEVIIEKLTNIYASMAQTDKVYSYVENIGTKKRDLIYPAASFIHVSDNIIKFARYKEGSESVVYNRGQMSFPLTDFNAYERMARKLNLQSYVTDDIGKLEQNLEAAKIKIAEYVTANPDAYNGTITEVVNTIYLMSRSEIMKKFTVEVYTDGTIQKIFTERLKQACFDNVDSGHAKRYLNYLNTGGNIDGNPFCVDAIGPNSYVAYGLDSDALTTKSGASRALQESWAAKEHEYTNAAIDKRHNLLIKLAQIKENIGYTDESLATTKFIAQSGGFGYIVAGTSLFFSKEEDNRIRKALFYNSGEKFQLKSVGNNLIVTAYAENTSMAVYAKSTLNFKIYDDLLAEKIKRQRDFSTGVASTSTLLSNALETNVSYSDVATLVKSGLGNPIVQFYQTLGLTEQCQDNLIKCTTPTSNTMKAVVQMGNEGISVSTKIIALSYGVSAVNKLTKAGVKPSKSEAKAKITDGNSKGGKAKKSIKYAKLFGDGADLILQVFGFVMVYVLALSVLAAKIIPLVAHLPFYIAYIFTAMVSCTLSYILFYFFIRIFLPNENNNILELLKQVLGILCVVLFMPTFLVFAKYLSTQLISAAFYALSLVMYFTFGMSDFLSMMMAMIALVLSALAATNVVTGVSLGMIQLFCEMLGIIWFFRDQPMEPARATERLFMQYLPAVTATKDIFTNNIKGMFKKTSK